MHFTRTGTAHHRDDFHRCCAAHDRLINKDDRLAVVGLHIGIVLELDASLAAGIGRLNEGPADIMIAYNPQLEGQAGLISIAEGGRDA